MVERSKRRGILSLVFGDIGNVDPLEGPHEHIVHSRRNISHGAHQEERQLQNTLFDEADARGGLVVPLCRAKVDDEAQEEQEDAHDKRRDSDHDTDGEAGGDGIGGLLVELAVEELWILEGAVCWSRVSLARVNGMRTS